MNTARQEIFLFINRHLVIGYKNAAPFSSIVLIQEVNGM